MPADYVAVEALISELPRVGAPSLRANAQAGITARLSIHSRNTSVNEDLRGTRKR